MGIGVTIALAVIGGLCTLAFKDMGAFKRLVRVLKPFVSNALVLGLGIALGGWIAENDGLAPADLVEAGATLAIVVAAFGALLYGLIWLREGFAGVNEV